MLTHEVTAIPITGVSEGQISAAAQLWRTLPRGLYRPGTFVAIGCDRVVASALSLVGLCDELERLGLSVATDVVIKHVDACPTPDW